MKPAFLTFTGIDAGTDLARVESLSNTYPIEWGVLFSPDRQGQEPRYPAMSVIDKFRNVDVRKSAHLCGNYSKMVMKGHSLPVDLSSFERVQVNSRNPDAKMIASFAADSLLSGIMQTRELEFPEDEGIAVLFDRSGGFGRPPEEWPRHPGDRLVGYAGGISHGANVRHTGDTPHSAPSARRNPCAFSKHGGKPSNARARSLCSEVRHSSSGSHHRKPVCAL